MSDYKPGTVADIDVPGRGWCRAFYVDGGLWLTAYAEADGIGDYETKNVSNVRPLVVLDPDDWEQVNAFCKRLVEVANAEREIALATSGIHPDTVAAALRSLTRPPKPAEPTGLGAVVEDSEGHLWVRTDPDAPAWTRWDASLTRVSYERIDVAKKLSDGWEPKP